MLSCHETLVVELVKMEVLSSDILSNSHSSTTNSENTHKLPSKESTCVSHVNLLFRISLL